MKKFRSHKGTGVKSRLDKIHANIKPNLLGHITNWATIVGTAISLLLSIWAIILTRKYGENQDQINRLTTIAKNQEVQIEKLVDMLEDLKTQNGLTQEQNLELRSQGRTISNQSLSLAKQLILFQEQRKESKSNLLIQRRADFTKLTKFKEELGLLLPYQGASYLKDYNFEDQKIFYQKLKVLFEKDYDNSIVLENDSIARKWDNLYKKITFDLQSLNTLSSSNYISVSSENGQIAIAKDSLTMRKGQRLWFGNFVDKLYDFYFSLIITFFKMEK